MAWGYWTSHSLTHHAPRPVSPAPTPIATTRDKSIERGAREVCGGSTWSELNSWTRTPPQPRNTTTPKLGRVDPKCGPVGPGPGGGGDQHRHHSLPRERTNNGIPPDSWVAETRSLVGDPHSSSKVVVGSSCEGPWCSGCQSGSGVVSSRVSFQSVKENSGGGIQTTGSSDKELSSSLPTPPPPPLQGLRTGGSREGTTCRRIYRGQEDCETPGSCCRKEGSGRIRRQETHARKHESIRDSCSSRESHKSLMSKRSSQEDSGTGLESCSRRPNTPEERRLASSIKSPHPSLTRTSSSDQDKQTILCSTSKESTSKSLGQMHKTEATDTDGVRTLKFRGGSENLKFDRDSVISPVKERAKCFSSYSLPRSGHHDWDTVRRNELIKINGGSGVWHAHTLERTGTEGRRSVTPEEDTYSFHETFEKEILRRRRSRRRSASFSSHCCEGQVRSENRPDRLLDSGRSCRLDSGTHSATGASSRNSSSRSEKSSTRSERSSRSPSIEHNKQGCNSSQCRARTSLC